MPELTQEGQLIAISVEGQEEDSLLLQGVMGVESMSRPFLFQLDVVTPSTDIDFTGILGKKALITLQTSDPDNPRYFSGFVTRFEQADSSGGMHRYNMEVGPWISFLGLNVNNMIFHNMSIPDILKKIFDNSPAKQKDTIDTSKITGTYNPVEYCVQYRESTLQFISRLMEHAGIFFYFTHTKDGHVLHLADDSTQMDTMPGQSSISYLYKNSGDPMEETIMSLQGKQGIKTGTHTLSNYNFKTPSTDLKTSEPTVITAGQNDDLEIFEYPSTHTTIEEGKALSKIRMQEQEATQHLVTGTSRARGLMAGFKFTVKDHPENGTADRNIEYLVTEIKHMITVGTAFTTGIGGQNYMNTFTCIPASVPYRPPRATPKPVIHGLQNAFVVGKSAGSGVDTPDDGAGGDGEEIWVDKYGRVMVRFLWDRAGACSCRVRVAQQWAGQAWGSIVIPRVGQEVLVSFLDGDPDRPIILGGVYNGAYTVPYILPEHQTRSSFMTRSTPQGSASTYNELRFEDKKGAEQVFVRGQYDYDTYVVNDTREWVGNNRSLVVTKDQMEKVSGDRHEQVTGKHTEKIGGDLNSNVTGNVNQKIGQNLSIQAGQNIYEKSGQTWAHEAGQTIHLKGGMTVVIEAGTELCLKVGGNYIDINPSGVTIFGTMVMINSGGSAGSGPGSSPTSPADPTDPDLADDGKSGTKRGSGDTQTSSAITLPPTAAAPAASGSSSVAAPPPPSPSSPDPSSPAGPLGAAAAAASQAINQVSQVASQAAQQAATTAQQAVQQATQAATQAAQQAVAEAQQAASQAQQAVQQVEQQAQQAVAQVTQQARQAYQQAQQAVQQAQQQVQQATAQGQAAAAQALAQAQQAAQQTAQQATQAVQQAQAQAQQAVQQAQQTAAQAQQAAQQAEQQAQQAAQQAKQQAQQAAQQAQQQVQQAENQAQQQVQQGMQTAQQAQQQVQQAAQQAQQQARQAAQQAQQAAQQAQQQVQQSAQQAQQAAQSASQQAQQAGKQVQQAAQQAGQQAQQAAQSAQNSASQAIGQAMRGF